MQALTISRTTATTIGRERPEIRPSALAGAAGLAAATLVLLALLPALAAAGSDVPLSGPRPLPAPGPAIVAVE